MTNQSPNSIEDKLEEGGKHGRLDSRWFYGDKTKEDRDSTEKAVRSATIYNRKLKKILRDMHSQLITEELDVTQPNFAEVARANYAKKAVLQDIYKLLP